MTHFEKCLVCNKTSSGKHYGVQTCNACKAFFLRSMGRQTDYLNCPSNQKCYSEDSSDDKCRECRFKKCIQLGMKLDNKSINGWEVCRQIEDPFPKPSVVIQVLVHVDSEVTKLRYSTYNPRIYPTLANVVETPSILYLASYLKPMPGWPLEKSNFIRTRKKLTLKRLEIENQGTADNSMIASMNHHEFNSKEWNIFEVLMGIEYAKTFSFFQKLEIKDKIVLIRETHVMMSLITTEYTSYLTKKDSLQAPDGIFHDDNLTKSDLEVMLAVEFSEQMPWVSLNFLSMEPYFRNKFTYEEYLFMKTLIFCNPVDELSPNGKHIVQQERQKYGKILLNHCLITRNDPSRFLTLLEHVHQLFRSQKKYKDFITFMRTMSTSTASKSRRLFEDQIYS